MDRIGTITGSTSWSYAAKGFFGAASILATGSVAGAVFAYRRIYADSALPFQHWKNLVGLSAPNPLTMEELTDSKLGTKYSPQELAERCFASLGLPKDEIVPIPIDPMVRERWVPLDWYNYLGSPIDLEEVNHILPSFQESPPLTIEDENAAQIQSWAMRLQPLFTLIRDHTTSWREIDLPIQTSPRFAFTILFNCLAPLAAKWMWDGIYDFLPTSIRQTGAVLYNHKVKVALACFGIILWLYYRMNQERGMLTNITENFARMHKTHRAIDLVPSYQKPIKELLRCIGRHEKGEPLSNILWYYNEHTHSTFKGDICDILGEFTATGRICDITFQNSLPGEEFSLLKDLQIVKLNLRSFLTQYRTVNEVYRGWNETLNQLKKKPNTLVVLSGLNSILEHLLPGKHQISRAEEPGSQVTNTVRPDNSLKVILAELVNEALQQGKFRCLMEVTEETKKKMETDSELIRLFTPIQSPNLSSEEIEKLCLDLYTQKDQIHTFSYDEITLLFKHLKPVLDVIPHAPSTILEVIEESLRDRVRQSSVGSQLGKNPSQTYQEIIKTERYLAEAHRIHNKILQEIWKKRIQREQVSNDLKKALMMMKHIIIPIYFKAALEHKKKPPLTINLIDKMQKRKSRLYGPCTSDEEVELLKLKEKLEISIKGQDSALNAMCRAVYEWRKIPFDNGKPLVLFFAGSTGVGKSETATILAYELNSIFGISQSSSRTYESNVIRINLNRETQGGEHGWDYIRNNVIVKQILQVPTTTIIFEEWDKMSSNEKSCLLELLDGTKIYYQEPGTNIQRFVDKSCVTIVLTANVDTGPVIPAATQPIITEPVAKDSPMRFLSRRSESSILRREAPPLVDKSGSVGTSAKTSAEVVRDGILECFPKEKQKDAEAFLSRIDAIVPFEKLGDIARAAIIKTSLDTYEKNGQLDPKNRTMIEVALAKSTKETTDARELIRLVRKTVFSKSIRQQSLSRISRSRSARDWLGNSNEEFK